MDLLKFSNTLAAKLTHRLIAEAKETANKRSSSADDSVDIDTIVYIYYDSFPIFTKHNNDIFNEIFKSASTENQVFIGIFEDDDVEDEISTIGFEKKKSLITSQFDITESRVVEIKNKVLPAEILQQFDKHTTAFILFVHPEFAELIRDTEYYSEVHTDIELESYAHHGYFIEVPSPAIHIGSTELSSVEALQILQSTTPSAEVKKLVLQSLFPSSKSISSDILRSLISPASIQRKRPDNTISGGSDFGPGNTPNKKGDDDPTTSKSGKKSDVHPMKQKILNPETGKEIKVQSALKYPRWKPVYKQAQKILQAHGIDRKDRTDKPRVNKTWNQRSLIPSYRKKQEKKKKNEQIELEYSIKKK